MTDIIPGIPRIGEILALGSAVVWAAAVILFRISGRSVPPLGLNLFKSIFATAALAVSMVILGESFLPAVEPKAWGLLLASGVLGIGLSDTLLFACLNRLGAGLTAIIDCSYSPSVILLAVIFLGERMAPIQMLGAGMIILAVILITREKNNSPLPRKQLLSGIALGVSAMFVMAVSVIIMKPILEDIPLIWATLVRTMGGIIFLTAVLAGHPRRRRILLDTFAPRNLKPMIPASLLGGFALLIWMGGMKYTLASVASALNQVTSVFIFLFGVLFLKEKSTLFKLMALGLAVVGAFLVTFS